MSQSAELPTETECEDKKRHQADNCSGDCNAPRCKAVETHFAAADANGSLPVDGYYRENYADGGSYHSGKARQDTLDVDHWVFPAGKSISPNIPAVRFPIVERFPRQLRQRRRMIGDCVERHHRTQ